MKRVVLLALSAALITVCPNTPTTGTTTPTPVVTPEISAVNSTIQNDSGTRTVALLLDNTSAASTTNPVLVSASVAVNGTFSLPLPSLTTIGTIPSSAHRSTSTCTSGMYLAGQGPSFRLSRVSLPAARTAQLQRRRRTGQPQGLARKSPTVEHEVRYGCREGVPSATEVDSLCGEGGLVVYTGRLTFVQKSTGLTQSGDDTFRTRAARQGLHKGGRICEMRGAQQQHIRCLEVGLIVRMVEPSEMVHVGHDRNARRPRYGQQPSRPADVGQQGGRTAGQQGLKCRLRGQKVMVPLPIAIGRVLPAGSYQSQRLRGRGSGEHGQSGVCQLRPHQTPCGIVPNAVSRRTGLPSRARPRARLTPTPLTFRCIECDTSPPAFGSVGSSRRITVSTLALPLTIRGRIG